MALTADGSILERNSQAVKGKNEIARIIPIGIIEQPAMRISA